MTVIALTGIPSRTLAEFPTLELSYFLAVTEIPSKTVAGIPPINSDKVSGFRTIQFSGNAQAH